MLSNIPRFKIDDILMAIKNNEFFLVAQPQVNLDTYELVGFEFLARWNHPKYGVIAPFHFIDLLEINEQCYLLTLTLFERMLQTIQPLDHTKTAIHYSLNMSANDLTIEGFAKQIGHLINQYQINADSIVLEVTETAGIFSNQSVANLRQLSQLGIQLAIDDFWTGFSTLETIRLNVFSEVKIDYSLTSQLINDKASMAGMNAILQLCSDLELRCVIEGIETCMARGILIEAGAKIGQGFLFDKGVEEHALKEWITNYTHSQYSAKCDNATLLLSEKELRLLELRPHPSWLWDFNTNKVIWANRSGVKFWGVESLKNLQAKTFNLMSYSVKTRLKSYYRRFVSGEAEISSEWDFYPNGRHKKVFCIQIPRVSQEGNYVMMVHAFEGFHSRLPNKKHFDSTNQFPAPFIIVNEQGALTRINKHAHIEIDIQTDQISEIIASDDFQNIKSACRGGHLVQTFVKNQKSDCQDVLYIRALMVPDQNTSEQCVYHIVLVPISDLLANEIPALKPVDN